ncbi:MAG: hypothetical protein JSS67_01875 [Bacteroidetes bacterium]|nr:hypothetical protein [Bacteroidota bacterium]
MLNRKILFFFIFIGIAGYLNAQRIFYSSAGKDDFRNTGFEIIGKINAHYLTYTTNRGVYYIQSFNGEMKTEQRMKLTFLPDRIISTDVIAYPHHFYFMYQYQRKNIVYYMAAMFDENANMIGEPVQLDTTAISTFTNNKIYTLVCSEDKEKFMLLKINKKKDMNVVTFSIFDKMLHPLKKNTEYVPISDRNVFLTEFNLDNDGNIIFLEANGSSQGGNISDLSLYQKQFNEDSLTHYAIDISKIYLDDARLKVDNVNHQYLVTSFYSKTRRGNIEGLYCFLWNRDQQKEIKSAQTVFSDEFRENAKLEGNTKTAFNDFFLQNIVMRQDGGFIVTSESEYTSSRGISSNRWDYAYGSPYWSPYSNYYWTSPYYGYYYPWDRWGNTTNPINRYYADNIALISFDSVLNMEWMNVIHKSQFDDNSDNFISFGTFTENNSFHFLYNELYRRDWLLSDQSINTSGKITKEATFHDLGEGYDFLARYAKQVSVNEMIIPCQYKSYLCFARIEF